MNFYEWRFYLASTIHHKEQVHEELRQFMIAGEKYYTMNTKDPYTERKRNSCGNYTFDNFVI